MGNIDKTESLKEARFDTSGNGKPDQFQYFTGSTQLKKVEFDTNGNEKIDRWEFFDSLGHLERVELDNNHDGKIDIVKKGAGEFNGS